MTAVDTAPFPVVAAAERMSMRRIIALTRGIRVTDVPDAAVADALRADRVPICWVCHEGHFSPRAPRCRVHGPLPKEPPVGEDGPQQMVMAFEPAT